MAGIKNNWAKNFFFIIQDVTGSSLLSVLDQFALDISPDTGNISSGNISEDSYRGTVSDFRL